MKNIWRNMQEYERNMINMKKVWRNMKKYEGILKDIWKNMEYEERMKKYEGILNGKYENKNSYLWNCPYIWAMGLTKILRSSLYLGGEGRGVRFAISRFRGTPGKRHETCQHDLYFLAWPINWTRNWGIPWVGVKYGTYKISVRVGGSGVNLKSWIQEKKEKGNVLVE